MGGNKKEESRSFIKKLKKILTQNDYQIIGEVTGGHFLTRRVATLYQDHVEVTTIAEELTKSSIPFKFPLEYLSQLFNY